MRPLFPILLTVNNHMDDHAKLAEPESAPEHTKNFGYQRVSAAQKTTLVNEVFDRVAHRYDIMNDLMSFGLHRWWKKLALAASNLRAGQKALDLAAGTADLSLLLARAIGPQGQIIVSDINANMLSYGKKRLINQGVIFADYLQANAEHLPLPDDYFDLVTISFGLRNITNHMQALGEMYRVLQPGGKVLILEFAPAPLPVIQKIYDYFSFNFIPWLGEIITHDRASYNYLVESIRLHPPQEHLKQLLEQAGFEEVFYTNLSGGIVALHIGYKY